MTDEVSSVLLRGHPVEYSAFDPLNCMEAHRQIDSFIAGMHVTVSRAKGKKKATFKKIEGANELWSFCLRYRKPGWRILGRFVKRDLFAGIKIMPRAAYGFGAESASMFAACASQCEATLSSFASVQSSDLSEYLTRPYHDLDNPDDQ